MPVTGGSQSTVTVQVPVPQQVQARPKAPVSFGTPTQRQLRPGAQLAAGDDESGIPPHPPGNLSAVILPWNPAQKPKRMRRVRVTLSRNTIRAQ